MILLSHDKVANGGSGSAARAIVYIRQRPELQRQRHAARARWHRLTARTSQRATQWQPSQSCYNDQNYYNGYYNGAWRVSVQVSQAKARRASRCKSPRQKRVAWRVSMQLSGIALACSSPWRDHRHRNRLEPWRGLPVCAPRLLPVLAAFDRALVTASVLATCSLPRHLQPDPQLSSPLCQRVPPACISSPVCLRTARTPLSVGGSTGAGIGGGRALLAGEERRWRGCCTGTASHDALKPEAEMASSKGSGNLAAEDAEDAAATRMESAACKAPSGGGRGG